MARKKSQNKNHSRQEKKSQSQERSSAQKEEIKKEEKSPSRENSDKSDDVTKPSETNDPEWYGLDPQVLVDAGSIPFSDVMGNKVVITPPGITFTTPEGTSMRVHGTVVDTSKPVPGICVLKTRSTFGNSKDRNDPANVAAFAIYTHVRYNNSGRKNYDQADLFIYSMSASDLYAYINWLIRIYNCAFMYSQRNLYIGKALLEAQGVNPNSVCENLPAFRYWINVFINKVASYAVPGSIPLFKKRAFLYSMIYTESTEGSVKDQLYMYCPVAFYRFTTDEMGKGMLQLEYLENPSFNRLDGRLTIKGLEQIGDLLLSEMWGDEDFGIMSGDILRAFNGDIVTLSQIGPEGGIVPVYDPFVLHQMKNSRLVGPSYETYNSSARYRIDVTPIGQTSTLYQYCKSGNVYQDMRGNIVCRNLLHWDSTEIEHDEIVSGIGLCSSPVISVNTPTVDPALVAEVTRNMPVITNKEALDMYVGINGERSPNELWIEYDPGDIVVETCDIMYKPLPLVGAQTSTFVKTILSNLIVATEGDDISSTSDKYGIGEIVLSAIGAFHYMPILFGYDVADFANAEITVKSPYPISDLNNYTVQDAEVIKRLHTVCMLSLLYVPGVAKSVNYLK